MIEAYGDLWEDFHGTKVITTNGFVKKDGSAVMGRGCALQAKQKFPGIEFELGHLLNDYGNICFILSRGNIITFPVKHNWWEKANLELIRKSAKDLSLLHELGDIKGPIFIPRPGCGNGQLTWSDVKPILEEILTSNDFVIVTNII